MVINQINYSSKEEFESLKIKSQMNFNLPSRYQDTHQQQQHRPQRNSYSGPPSSDVFYRGQEVGRPMQEYYASQVGAKL